MYVWINVSQSHIIDLYSLSISQNSFYFIVHLFIYFNVLVIYIISISFQFTFYKQVILFINVIKLFLFHQSFFFFLYNIFFIFILYAISLIHIPKASCTLYQSRKALSISLFIFLSFFIDLPVLLYIYFLYYVNKLFGYFCLIIFLF